LIYPGPEIKKIGNTKMKTLILTFVLIAAAFMFSACNDADILTGNDQPETYDSNVPFKGNFDAIAVTVGGAPPVINKKLTGSGNSTHTGNFTTEVYYDVVFTSQGGGILINGNGYMIAANGDRINLVNMSGDWQFNAWPPTEVTFTLNGSIQGGTGRFTNAAGSFNGSGSQEIDINVDPTPTHYEWNGTISY
jgi:hypothetical protein